jgi:hypothetical protein
MFPSKIAGLVQGVLGKVTFWLMLAPWCCEQGLSPAILERDAFRTVKVACAGINSFPYAAERCFPSASDLIRILFLADDHIYLVGHATFVSLDIHRVVFAYLNFFVNL